MKVGFFAEEHDKFSRDVMKILESKGYEVSFTNLQEEGFDLIVDNKEDFLSKSLLKNLSMQGIYIMNNPFSEVSDIYFKTNSQ